MSEDFNKYLAIANHDIQMANDYGQLKSYVASILYDNDKKAELLQQKENIIKEVREYLESNDIMKVSKEKETKGTIFCCDKELLEILDKENK